MLTLTFDKVFLQGRNTKGKQMNELLVEVTVALRGMPVRLATITSGQPEVDASAKPVVIFFRGPFGEKHADEVQQGLRLPGCVVRRVGPRDLRIEKSVSLSHVSDETVSF